MPTFRNLKPTIDSMLNPGPQPLRDSNRRQPRAFSAPLIQHMEIDSSYEYGDQICEAGCNEPVKSPTQEGRIEGQVGAFDSPMTLDPQPTINGPSLLDGLRNIPPTPDASSSSLSAADPLSQDRCPSPLISSSSRTLNDTEHDTDDSNTYVEDQPSTVIPISEKITTHFGGSISKLLDVALASSDAAQREMEEHDGERESAFRVFYLRKARNVGLPWALKIFSPAHAGEAEPFPMPRIYQFADMLHLVRCFRDIVLDHRRMWMDGILHHDVTVYTMLLGRVDAKVGLVGKLCRSKDPIYLNPLDPRADMMDMSYESHPDTQRMSFKSIIQLSRMSRPKLIWPEDDHLDDMERMVYALAWIAGYMDGPQRLRLATDTLEWEVPTARESSFEKRYMMSSPTLTHLNTYFWRPAFWKMFERLCEICVNRINTKLKIAKLVDDGVYDRFPTLRDMRKQFGGRDHDRFLGVIEAAIAEMEMMPDDKDNIGPRKRQPFSFTDLRAQSALHKKRPRRREPTENQLVAQEANRKIGKEAAELLGSVFS